MSEVNYTSTLQSGFKTLRKRAGDWSGPIIDSIKLLKPKYVIVTSYTIIIILIFYDCMVTENWRFKVTSNRKNTQNPKLDTFWMSAGLAIRCFIHVALASVNEDFTKWSWCWPFLNLYLYQGSNKPNVKWRFFAEFVVMSLSWHVDNDCVTFKKSSQDMI